MLEDVTSPSREWLDYHIDITKQQGIIHRSFLTSISIQEAINCFNSIAERNKVDGKIGVAYERYEDIYVCDKGLTLTKELRIHPRKGLRCCASLVKFDSLGGMTSHRDYSYNKYCLATACLEGSVLFGSASVREETYNPENLVLLNPGDVVLLKAPYELNNNERPFFSMFCPVPSMISRVWFRDPSTCEAAERIKHG